VLTGGLAEQHRAIPTAVRRRLRLAGVMRMFPARAPLKAIDLNATRRMQLYVEKLEELPTGPKGS
jgi:butyrate kinase